MIARGQGAGGRLQGHGAIPAAGAGAEGQPAGVLACGPSQGAAAGVADAERLHDGVTAPLDRGEREARGTCADGRWDRCRRDSEGDGDGDRGCAVGPHCDPAIIGSGGKRTGCDADGYRASSHTITWRVR